MRDTIQAVSTMSQYAVHLAEWDLLEVGSTAYKQMGEAAKIQAEQVGNLFLRLNDQIERTLQRYGDDKLKQRLECMAPIYEAMQGLETVIEMYAPLLFLSIRRDEQSIESRPESD